MALTVRAFISAHFLAFDVIIVFIPYRNVAIHLLAGGDMMTPANDSNGLYLRLLVMFIVFVIAGFMIPHETLNNDQLLLLWLLMPFVGWLWIQTHMDAEKRN